MTLLLVVAYLAATAGLLVYGVHALVLLVAYQRGRAGHQAEIDAARARAAAAGDEACPLVTVQLPVFNERLVADRLLDAVAALDWPSGRLQVQILDDSTDETTDLVAAGVARLARDGLDVEHLRRTDRAGYKAGALAAGLAVARGDVIAVFDADFVPAPDVLRRTVPLLDRPDVGLVQARWGHLNRDHGWLTRVQALAIDGHFGIEQAARRRAGWFLNFNGTAGVWRRQAIEDAGGWTADTLTEDLDLSYRAQLAGWRLEYVGDTEVPAELPAELLAFKSQQRRWAQGSIQTAVKLLPRLLSADLRAGTKLAAVLHLTHYLVHPLMVAVAVMAPPALSALGEHLGTTGYRLLAAAMLLGMSGPSTLYLASQRLLGRDLRRRARDLPLLMIVGTGIAVSNTRAVLAGLTGRGGRFERTPKQRLTDGSREVPAGSYRPAGDTGLLAEAALAAWASYGLLLSLRDGRWVLGPFLALYAVGFAVVAVRSAAETARRHRARRPGLHGLPVAGR